MNEPYWEGQVWWWSRSDAGEYKEAWVRMHDIFEKEGANKSVEWSTKMIAGGFGPQNRALDWAAYTPPKEYLNIIGWNCNSNIGPYADQYSPTATIRLSSKHLTASTIFITRAEKFSIRPTKNGAFERSAWPSQIK